VTTESEIQQEVFGGDLKSQLLGLLRPGSLRPLGRIIGMTAWTVGMLGVLLIGMWATTPWKAGRLRWRNRTVRRWARGMAWIVNMRMVVQGTPPRAPFFLVANHLSYVDIVLLFATVDGVFVAKHELAAWPAIGYLTRLVGTVFVNRRNRRDTKRVLTAIERRIGEGDGVIVFPEGTSSEGSDVYPMKTALFEWAARVGYPIHVATIHYATGAGLPPAREVVCWWGAMTFVPHVVALCRLPGFEATVHFGAVPLTGNDRAELAVRAREAIAANFVTHEAGYLETR
jgi:1-acyl-sn-glycerol-3-phosphate acyltransferase